MRAGRWTVRGAVAAAVVVLVAAGCGSGSPQARVTRTVTVAAPTSPVITPEVDTSSTTTEPETTTTEPETHTTTHTTRPRQEAQAPTFSGHVRTPQGRPAAGVVVEFKRYPYCADVCQQPFVHTDGHGAYAITLPPGTYNALCVVDIGWECAAAGGDGGPHLVDVPPAGQEVDFVVCPEDDYPACLG